MTIDRSFPSAEEPPSPATGASRPLTIFIVENHDDTRFLLGLLLEQLGHTVHSAANVTQALEQIPGYACDVLISDIGLPDGNGWELLTSLGEDRPPYAIAMSGFGMTSDRQRSLAAGFQHHLLKPVEPNHLERLLEEAANATAR